MTELVRERRRYFRVSDLVGIRYRFLSENEIDVAVKAQPSSLNSLLGQLDEQITVALAKQKNTSPDIYTLMDLFNQKINLAFDQRFAKDDEVETDAVRACQVNLSACGIAFPSTESANLNQHLEMELTLYQANLKLGLVAAVISCDDYHDENDGNTHLIRADFVNVSDADQEQLIQYIIKRQTQQIKEQRNQAD